METAMRDAIAGCLLGAAVGDALGLPYEGLAARRARRLLGPLTGHKLLFGRGMTSDDTEHACMVAEALIESAGDPATFERALAWGLRRWLATLPPAAGLATLRATFILCLGFGPRRSGVYSAGNAPAMRVAPIGVCFGAEPERLRSLVAAQTRITHTDPKAEHAALAVAIAADLSRRGVAVPAVYLAAVRDALAGEHSEFLNVLEAAVASVESGESTAELVIRMGWKNGPSGYCLQSVPAALHAWMRNAGDYRATVVAAIECGGDADTVAAIAGAIAGARAGVAGIPLEWIAGIADWPRTVKWLRKLASALADAMGSRAAAPAPRLPYPALLLRNVVFTAIVIAHGLRRLLPPY
jgi:ADP-ribosyl-[dinitrogen reductase] hydrolase